MPDTLVLRTKENILYLGHKPKKHSKKYYAELGYKAGVFCDACDTLICATDIYSTYMYITNRIDSLMRKKVTCPCCGKDIEYTTVFMANSDVLIL